MINDNFVYKNHMNFLGLKYERDIGLTLEIFLDLLDEV